MRTRMPRSTEALDMHARSLAPLSLGDKVFLQNQRGSHPSACSHICIVIVQCMTNVSHNTFYFLCKNVAIQVINR